MNEQDHNKTPAEDNPFKKAAMATIGAVSGAVEKVADAIGDLASKENIDKMAKKGEEVYGQVKEFSAQTIEKVKTSIGDTFSAEPLDVEAAKEQLHQLMGRAEATIKEAGQRLHQVVSKDDFEEWAEALSHSIKEEKSKIDKLLARVRAQGKPGAVDEAGIRHVGEDTFDDRPQDGDIPYEGDHQPEAEDQRMDRRPAGVGEATPTAPSDEDNINKLASEVRNEHIPQQVPPEY